MVAPKAARAALEYLAMEWSVLPVREHTKRRLIIWEALRPPLDDAEVAQVVDNIVHLHVDEASNPTQNRHGRAFIGGFAGGRSDR